MTPEAPTPPEPEQEQMSEVSRLSGVFFEPSKTFADIAERPRWFIPLLITILASLAFVTAISSRIGWERVVRQQLEQRMATMSQQQREAAEKNMPLAIKITQVSVYGAAVLITPLIAIIAAAILLGIANGFMSAGLRFKQMFAIQCYAGLPRVLYAALGIAVMFVKRPEDFDMQNPVGFNPGAYMDPNSTSKFLYSLASSLDLFTIWSILLIAAGIWAATNKRVSYGGALAAVAVPWGILVFCAAALRAAFA